MPSDNCSIVRHRLASAEDGASLAGGLILMASETLELWLELHR